MNCARSSGGNGRTFCQPLRHLLEGIDCELVEPGDPTVAISDPNDQPILDAAVAAAVDVLVTGDKAFLGLDLVQLRIVTARQFIDEFAG